MSSAATEDTGPAAISSTASHLSHDDAATKPAAATHSFLERFTSQILWCGVALLALVCYLFGDQAAWLVKFPAAWHLPLATWLSSIAEVVTGFLTPAARLFSHALEVPMIALRDLLQWIPWPALTLASVALAVLSGASLPTVLFTLFALCYIALSGYWIQAMNTLALVAVAVPLSIFIGLIGGIAARYSSKCRRVIEPTLDLMQTMPTFAYLIPLLVLFGFGPVVGLIASAIFAAPAMVRNVSLGLQRVSPSISEAGRISGTTFLQQLLLIELPAAREQIKIGLNQTIMAALAMVIIAAVIGGFNDIGWEVLSTMRKARFGDSLIAGAVIVAMAIVLDRVSAAFATDTPASQANLLFLPRKNTALLLLLLAFVAAVLFLLLGFQTPEDVALIRNMGIAIDDNLTRFVGEAGETLTNIKNTAFYYYLLPLRIGLNQAILPFTWGFEFTTSMKLGFLLGSLLVAAVIAAAFSWRAAVSVMLFAYIIFFGLVGAPWIVLCAAFTVLAWLSAGRGLAIFVLATCALALTTGLWEKSMLSLYLCGAAAIMAFVIGALLGIGAAASDHFSALLRPILDTFQTIPMFVFLIPVLMLFQIGEFTALLAIVAYAFVPAARYTENGLRQVDKGLIEVAEMQGCTRWQVFTNVKLPGALPVILLGLNQTVLFSFAMLVITALVGTTGLGQQVYIALNSADIGSGLIAGCSMAFLAMIIDRMLRGWSARLAH